MMRGNVSRLGSTPPARSKEQAVGLVELEKRSLRLHLRVYTSTTEQAAAANYF